MENLNSEKKDQPFKLNTLSKWMIGLAFFFIILSFTAPYLLTEYSILDLSDKGTIGDALGGTMNPFIAIGGIFLTYLAFYMQFEANKIQRSQFETQLDESKKQFKDELQQQQLEFNKSQFENQFYEMLKFHKENVNDISITLINENYAIEVKISGRETFKYYLEEMKILYMLCKKHCPNYSVDRVMNISYGLFFQGVLDDKKINYNNKIDDCIIDFYNAITEINDELKKENFKNSKKIIDNFLNYKPSINLEYLLGENHSFNLAHYYRHLYQTVKHVASQKENFISYNEKRKYLRILRAQLSNQEQAMLFYNWKSEFGKNWEAKNRFFTDYRMIHNLNNDLLVSDFDLKKIFNLDKEELYRCEEGKETDSIFEFQDWQS
ncbi:putative phage abortive infection protein [Flavobacterium beibuense]|uniref:putative phage abortive infection protein n=1 Tax=Flavobacterium beibuense TaxID=657326 RepID=UPI003A93C571